jgi:hypothetical protein
VLSSAVVPAVAAATHAPASTSQVIHAAGGQVVLHRVGTVNLGALARADARKAGSSVAKSAARVPLGPPPNAHKARRPAPAVGHDSLTGFSGGQVAGERGFDGLTNALQSATNPTSVGAPGDISPPDMGLAVGTSPAGTAIAQFINSALNIYSPSGKTLLGALPAYQVFNAPSKFFFGDPRAYWDPQTRHWFFTMITFGILGSGKPNGKAAQYIAVSQTTSPFGGFTVFSFSTNDSHTPGCPCFGDFDQAGLDNSGLYIGTTEFGQTSGAFNGAILYAASKSGLIAAARGNGPAPVIQRYRVHPSSDPFGSFHLSPSAVTQGSSSPNTEYFVESNANAFFGSGLQVYALLGTSKLNSGGRPTLVRTHVGTESYSLPPNAVQKSGPFPYGQSLGQTGVGQLQTDFDAVQEVTYANGMLYAELNSGFNVGTGTNSGAAWFVLHPTVTSSSVHATLAGDGKVVTSQNLLYPVIGVGANGHGYLSFAVSGASRWPSTGYMVFKGAKGPRGPIFISGHGASPLDDFTCYPPDSSGQCRYGDYSMSQNYNGKIYVSAEYTAPQPRDTKSNWGTRIWDAPVP